jgi:hypothetical protein
MSPATSAGPPAGRPRAHARADAQPGLGRLPAPAVPADHHPRRSRHDSRPGEAGFHRPCFRYLNLDGGSRHHVLMEDIRLDSPYLLSLPSSERTRGSRPAAWTPARPMTNKPRSRTPQAQHRTPLDNLLHGIFLPHTRDLPDHYLPTRSQAVSGLINIQ